MDIIKGRLLFDAFSDVFMSCICFANTVNICGNKHIFIVIVIVVSIRIYVSWSVCGKIAQNFAGMMPRLISYNLPKMVISARICSS